MKNTINGMSNVRMATVEMMEHNGILNKSIKKADWLNLEDDIVELIESLRECQYRLQEESYDIQDIDCWCEDNDIELSEDEKQQVLLEYRENYDCDLGTWRNIERTVNFVKEKNN